MIKKYINLFIGSIEIILHNSRYSIIKVKYSTTIIKMKIQILLPIIIAKQTKFIRTNNVLNIKTLPIKIFICDQALITKKVSVKITIEHKTIYS